ncbi:MAG: hypothetical protein IJ460_01240 [Clostridia bacterium]|nr:hypothetical protein [Clostridia bacterium]
MQTITNAADLNAQSIPDREIEGIARSILNLADTVMAKPGMRERYEAWKQKRKSKRSDCQ